MPSWHFGAECFALYSLFGRPDRRLRICDTVSVSSGALYGSVRDTTGAAKVGGYYVEDLIGSSTEFIDFVCFCA
jgi:hypothetical protein